MIVSSHGLLPSLMALMVLFFNEITWAKTKNSRVRANSTILWARKSWKKLYLWAKIPQNLWASNELVMRNFLSSCELITRLQYGPNTRPPHLDRRSYSHEDNFVNSYWILFGRRCDGREILYLIFIVKTHDGQLCFNK